MGGSNSNEKERDLTPAQKQQLQALYQNSGLHTYDHHQEGFIVPRDRGHNAYEEVKHYQAAQKMQKAKNVNLKASSNEALILPTTITVEADQNYINGYGLKFDYKIAISSIVFVSFSCPQSQVQLSDEISKRRYDGDPVKHGVQNTISFTYNPADFSGCGLAQGRIHIIAQYAPTERRQNENILDLKFNESMNQCNIIKNIVRINGHDYKMKTVYGMPAKKETDDNVCLVCLENPKNIVVKPGSHMCICNICADPMLRGGHKCPVCRSVIEEIEKLDITQ